VITLSAYTILHLGQALAKDMTTLLVTRFLAGFFAVSPLTNANGVIVDLWDPVSRGAATSLFTVCVFLGPVMGPIVGGYVSQSHLGWRWVFWVMMIFAGFCSLLALVALPETYPPVLLANKAKRLRKADPVANKNLYAELDKQDWSVMGVLRRTLLRPFHMLALEPILVLVTIYLSIVYGLLYARTYRFFLYPIHRSNLGRQFSRPSPSFSRSSAASPPRKSASSSSALA
jgi:MFS transporter, DHA1 family, multidrug resistance protein